MTTYLETRTLDLLKQKGRAGSIPPITLRRGEYGKTIAIYITHNEEAYDLTGYTARFCAMNAKHEFLKRTCTVADAANGLLTYAITSDLTAWAGPVLVAYVELTKTGEVATSDTLPFIVLDDADVTTEEAAAYQSYISELLDEVGAQAVALAQGSVDDKLDDFEEAYETAENSRDAVFAAHEDARQASYEAAEESRNVNTDSFFTVVDGALCVTWYDSDDITPVN